MQPSPESTSPAVLIVADDPILMDRCRESLDSSDVQLWFQWSQTPPDVQLDVVIIAGPRPAASQHGEPRSMTTDQPGLISLGEPVPDADVVLPREFLPRELLTACRLLSTIVRLRRCLADGQLTGTRLEQEANCDVLTQLPNRRAWEAELALRLAVSAPRPQCLAVVDIDHFKQVNDGWGHTAGDQLLVATATALRQSLRQDDFVARLGGDEFGLLLAGLESSAMIAVLQRVQVNLPARIAASSRQVASVSIGFACSSAAVVTGKDLKQAADEAVRQAKRQGRNCVVGGNLPDE